MFGLLSRSLLAPALGARLGRFQQSKFIHSSRIFYGVGEMNWLSDLAGEKFTHGKRKYELEFKLQDESNSRFFKIIESNPKGRTSILIPEEDIDVFNKVLMNFMIEFSDIDESDTYGKKILMSEDISSSQGARFDKNLKLIQNKFGRFVDIDCHKNHIYIEFEGIRKLLGAIDEMRNYAKQDL